jgi:hypothetical protein
MFDDPNLKNTSQTPSNLPMGEPEDMFADTDVDDSAQAVKTPTSAMGVGKLQPKANEQVISPEQGGGFSQPPAQPSAIPPAPPSAGMEPKMHVMPDEAVELNNKLKGPTFAKNFMIIFIVFVGIAILGGGSWLVYSFFIKAPAPSDEIETFTQQTIDEEEEEMVVEEENNVFIYETEEEVTTGESEVDVIEEITDEAVLFGEPIDSDNDNLSDNKERELGTNPNNWDSDGDGLGDGEEVNVWKTNPMNSDTDGDSYSDGSEVENGYNPAGPGKIFDASF